MSCLIIGIRLLVTVPSSWCDVKCSMRGFNVRPAAKRMILSPSLTIRLAPLPLHPQDMFLPVCITSC